MQKITNLLILADSTQLKEPYLEKRILFTFKIKVIGEKITKY